MFELSKYNIFPAGSQGKMCGKRLLSLRCAIIYLDLCSVFGNIFRFFRKAVSFGGFGGRSTDQKAELLRIALLKVLRHE